MIPQTEANSVREPNQKNVEEKNVEEKNVEEIKVKAFECNGIKYLKTKNGIVYLRETQEEVGFWNEETQEIIFNDENEDEEEEEDEDEE